VLPDLTLPGYPNVFLIGDMASVPGVPGMAQAAIQGAKYAARAIKEANRGDRSPFRYFDMGSMATVSRFSAVVKIGPLEFGGFFGWTTLAPNQNAVLAYTTTDPNYRLRITIDYEDEAGYRWHRTDTSQPKDAMLLDLRANDCSRFDQGEGNSVIAAPHSAPGLSRSPCRSSMRS
jgi:hypothetical protein